MTQDNTRLWLEGLPHCMELIGMVNSKECYSLIERREMDDEAGEEDISRCVVEASRVLLRVQARQLAMPPWKTDEPAKPWSYDLVQSCRLLIEAHIGSGFYGLQQVTGILAAVARAVHGTEQSDKLWKFLDERLEGAGDLLLKFKTQSVYRKIRVAEEAPA